MKIAYLYGDFDDAKIAKSRRPKILPNPLPNTIDALAILAATTPYLANVVYKIIALWFQRENAKFIRIKIKDGEIEYEANGGVSSREIERAFSQARKLFKKVGEDKLKVELPPGVDRSISVEMVKAAGKKKGGKE
jgi:hypothetical protein